MTTRHPQASDQKRRGNLVLPDPPLTGLCKNEIIATNRPRHLWIPAYAGMMEWA